MLAGDARGVLLAMRNLADWPVFHIKEMEDSHGFV